MPVYLIKLYSSVFLVAIILLQGCALDQFAKKDELPSSTPTGGYPGDPTYTPPPYGQPIVVGTPTGFPGYDMTTYHYVQTGDTLYRISVMYGVTTNDLLRWNPGINPNDLRAGQRIAVSGGPTGSAPSAPSAPPIYTPPVASPPAYTPPPSQPSGASYHVVQAGETLFRISRMYGVTVEQLMAWNRGVDANSLSIGQRLMVVPTDTRATTPAAPAAPAAPIYTPPPAASTAFHTVQQGDTLYNISRRYNMSVEQLANLNNLRQPYPPLSIGQQLRVSGSAVMPNSLAPRTTTNYHTVQAGENLYRIALRYGYTTEQVANWNNLPPPYNLSVGQQLVIYPSGGTSGVNMQSRNQVTNPVTSQAAPPAPVLPAVRAPSHHIVERNETLSTIAKKYDVTVQELAIWNGIGSPYTVFPGQKLLIP